MAGKALQVIYCWIRTVDELTVYMASTERGACRIGLRLKGIKDCQDFFREYFPGAHILKDYQANIRLLETVISLLSGTPPGEIPTLDISLTPFQRQVFETVGRIHFGATSTYKEVARSIGMPKAARAVGRALGANPMPIIFP